MKLSRESRIVKWAYLFDADSKIPDRTSLCEIFWRSVLYAPLKLLSLAVCVFVFVPAIIYRVGTWLITMLLQHSHQIIAALVFVGMVVVVLTVFAILRRIGAVSGVTGSVLWQGAKAVKSKACPIVEIER